MRILNICFFISTLFFYACQETIEIPYEDYDEKIVVYCMLEPGKPPQANIMESKGLDTPDELQGSVVFLNDAVVTLFEGTTAHPMYLVKGVEQLPDGGDTYYFTDTGVTIEIGKSYRLEVMQGGRLVSGETYVPAQVPVTSVTHDVVSIDYEDPSGYISGTIRIKYFFDNPAGIGDNFEVVNFNDVSFSLSNYDVESILRDSIQERHENEVLYYFSSQAHEVQLIAYTINYPKTTADFIESLASAKYSGQDPFSEVSEVVSTISGGIGLFGARTVSDTTTWDLKLK
ncbi:MAG: DUF4249 family protein [Bacteroidia bacterium]